MAKAKKYVVAKGYSFTSGGYIYSAGEDIPEGAFPNKNVLAKFLSAGKVVEAEAEKKAALEAAKAALGKAEKEEAAALEAAKIAAEKAALEKATDEEKIVAEELQTAAEKAVKAREEAEEAVKALE